MLPLLLYPYHILIGSQNSIFFLIKTLFFRVVLVWQKNCMRKFRAFLYTPHHRTWTVFSIINMPHQNWWICLLMLDNLLKSIVCVRVHSWCDTFYEFGQTYWHASLLLFTALKFLSVLPIDSCPPPQSLVTTNSFTISAILSFPCTMAWIIQCIAYSDWFLSFGSMHSIFLHVFSWLDSTFLFTADNILLLYVPHGLFIH